MTTPTAPPEAGTPSFADRWRQRARRLKAETLALYLAYRDPRTPWFSRLWAALVIGYAFSPIDLIPDFIPILGYVDDLLLLPLGVALALRLIPAEVMADARQGAETLSQHPVSRIAAVAIVLTWVLLAALALHWLSGFLG